MLLIENPGEVVTRDELQRRLWPADTYVNFEHSLNAAVKRLRRGLGIRLRTRGPSKHCRGGATGLLRLCLTWAMFPLPHLPPKARSRAT